MRVMPRGYSHDVRGDGTTVVKRYGGPLASRRAATERDTLLRLADSGLPVPRVLDSSPLVLITAHLPGVHGQELIENGHAADVLRSCGETLRRIPPPLVHGDYGPNNTLYDPSTYAVTAVLDWEFAHEGDQVEDLAWAEWIIRTHHTDEVPALAALFDGYGHRPPWPVRHEHMLAKCRQMLAQPRLHQSGRDRWRRNITVTASWTEL
ncbi:phosphotransferase [Actinoplanes sp. NPDC051470]|uniref:aminoglycoside phosphotransferase family protein n=1 Tax=Actinoplanes sp. NPDC051470 TaxID=3157224 RepID=UPI0034344646